MLADFCSRMLDTITEVTGQVFSAADIHTWQIRESVPLTDNAWKEINMRVGEPGWCDSLDVLGGDDTRRALRVLQSRHEVHVVTSSWASGTWASERTAWLWREFGIPYNRVHHSHDKRLFAGQVFVDDKPANVESWREAWHWVAGRAVLWDQPYNARDLVHAKVTRTSSWDRVIQIADGEE